MRIDGIRAKQKKSFRPRTTIRAREEILAPNRLKNLNLHTLKKDQVWVSDITYIHTRQGWLYLAAIMDRMSRKIVGWALEDHMKKELIEIALERALKNRTPFPGLIFHSDRGSQYTSRSLQKRLQTCKIQPSMSAIGYCYDNAAMESFWSSLKNEALDQSCSFESKQQARLCLFEYIEMYYNKKRLHSSLDYMSPENYESKQSIIKN
jgi:transposase InsO family protein